MHTEYGVEMRKHSTPLPVDLARAPLRTIRPADAANVYAHPRAQMRRLAESGVLHRLADGYYVVVPQTEVGRPWLPALEAAAAGIGSAIYGPDAAVLMGVSAARMYGAIPRALAVAVVAVPTQHRPISLSDRTAIVRFVKRNIAAVDAERVDTELGPALVTTPEQTILDLAHRSELGDSASDIPAAVAALYARCDQPRLEALAYRQRRLASLRRAQDWVGALT
jgi:predicted transcriptional regulator of viral defense system